MSKQCLFLTFLMIFTVSCGQKSVIKNDVKAERLANAYGDGKHIIRNLTFPLEDSSMAFKTPLPGIAPIVGGLVKFIGDVFAANTKLGKMEMSYTQPVPEIPTELQSVRLKRFFLYLKPKKLQSRRFKDVLRHWLDRYILDRGDPTFGFLDKMALKLGTTNVEDPDHYESEMISKLAEKDYQSLISLFKKNASRGRVVDTEVAKEVVLVKYFKKNKVNDNVINKYGAIHYLELDYDQIQKEVELDMRRSGIEYTPESLKALTDKKMKKIQVGLKSFFIDDAVNWKHFERVLIFENSLLVELKKDPVANEVFQKIMDENAEKFENEYYVNYIDTCSTLSCLEVNVPDVNLVPIANKGNAIKLDAIIHAGSVPDSFKLKGFVEVEVKVDSPI